MGYWTPLTAQLTPHFDLLTLEEGISNGFVTSMYQDELGLLWLGTANGLNRYDAYSFYSFPAAPADSNRLSNPLIWTITGDDQGYLWVGTADGLNRFDPRTERSVQFFHDPEDSLSISNDEIVSLEKDREGNIWIGTANGLNLRRKDGAGFIRFFYEEAPSVSPMVKGILADRAGNLWVGCLDTLFQKRRGEAFFPIALPAPPDGLRELNFIRTIYRDHKDRLWIGTEGNGVWVYDTGTRSFVNHYYHKAREEQNLSHNRVTAVLEYQAGQYWVSTYGGGINIIDENAGRITPVSATTGHRLGANKIRSMLKDEAGNIWIGTDYEGLYLVKKYKKQFRNYTQRNSGLLFSKGCCSLTETADGKLWVGTQGSGLHHFNPETDEFRYFQHHPDDPGSLPTNFIMGISRDRLGRLWINHDGGLVARLDEKSEQFTRIDPNDFGFGHPWLSYIHADPEHTVWIGSQSGLYRYFPETQHLKRYSLPPAAETKRNNNFINRIYEDPDQGLWIATQAGLNRYDRSLDQWQHFSCAFWVLDIYRSRNGKYWAATRDGLASFDPSSGRFELVDRAELKRTILAILEDQMGRLWLGTPVGLACFDPENNRYISYNRKDGLVNNQFLGGKLLASNGEMYLTGVEGFTRFRPEEIALNTYQPPTVITSFQLFNQEVSIRGSPGDTLSRKLSLEKHILYTSELRLKYWQNDISFEFAALDFTAPENIRYHYQLIGYDQHQITTSAQKRSAHYTLPPGHYALEVRSTNNDGLRSDQEAVLSIIVLPPWWRSWWASLLWIVMAIVSIYGLYRFQLNRQLARAEYRQLQQLDAFKSQFYTYFTHEFRTPLTVIMGLSGQLGNQLSEHLREKIKIIKRNGRHLLRLVDQMLDLSKLESGHLQLEYEQADIIAYLRYLLKSFHSLAGSREVALHFESEMDEFYMDYDPVRLMHVISNLVSNAIKFNRSGGRVKLVIDRPDVAENGRIQIKVKDNGIGIPEEKLPFIFDRFYQVSDPAYRRQAGSGIGLAFIKELVTLMDGTISVQSEKGKGSTFTVALPVSKKAPVKNVRAPDLIPVRAVDDRSSENRPGHGKPEKPLVLVVEDHADLVRYLRSTLASDYQVEIATDGSRGIEKAKQLIPDIIITDLMIPETNGYELCRTLKAFPMTSHIPIIILTAKVDVDSRLTGFRQGADAYLEKPFLEEELRVRISGLLEQRQHLRAYYRAKLRAQDTSPDPPVPGDNKNIQDEFLSRVDEMIYSNLDNDQFTVAQLAGELFVDPSNLYRKIKALTDLSPRQYLQSLRLAEARRLLTTTSLSIQTIASQCGFAHASYFNRLFKKATDMTPGQFRTAGRK